MKDLFYRSTLLVTLVSLAACGTDPINRSTASDAKAVLARPAPALRADSSAPVNAVVSAANTPAANRSAPVANVHGAGLDAHALDSHTAPIAANPHAGVNAVTPHDATNSAAHGPLPTSAANASAAPAAIAAATSPAAHLDSAPAAHDEAPSVAADVALGWLKNGNKRFVKNNLRTDGQSIQDRLRLSKGQHPHTIVLSCSDSRVPPELVFDQKLGEIFVVRTAGEALDFSAIASIEYAVEHLGAQLIFVMGHESCGAVKAAIETPPGQSAGSPDLDKLVQNILPRIQSSLRMPASKGVLTESSLNAKGAASELLQRSEILRKKVESGIVKIANGVYHLDTGAVDFN